MPRGAWNLALGALGAAGAVGTGLWAESTVAHAGAAHEVMTVHKYLGLLLLALSVLLVLWRRRVVEPVPPRARAAYLGVAAILLALVLGTGHWGGRLVFEHRVGVTPAPVPPADTAAEPGVAGPGVASGSTGHEHEGHAGHEH